MTMQSKQLKLWESEQILQELETDRVLTTEQFKRFYPDQEIPKEAYRAQFSIKPCITQKEIVNTELLSLNPNLLGAQTTVLGHLLGLAEMRWHLEAAAGDWRHAETTSDSAEIPDAVWSAPFGICPIEYDAGSYTTHKISRKLEAFSQFSGKVIWGVPSLSRRNRLKERWGVMNVLYICWWPSNLKMGVRK